MAGVLFTGIVIRYVFSDSKTIKELRSQNQELRDECKRLRDTEASALKEARKYNLEIQKRVAELEDMIDHERATCEELRERANTMEEALRRLNVTLPRQGFSIRRRRRDDESSSSTGNIPTLPERNEKDNDAND